MVIEDLQVAIGILNKEGIDYTFPHRSLQEYFAANYISNLSEANKKIIFFKMKEAIKKRWFYLLDNHHFLTLLAEQDYRSVLTELAIPLFEEQFERLSNNNLITAGEMYDTQCKIFLIGTHILQKGIRQESIHQDFCDSMRPKVILMGDSNEYFTLSQLEKQNIKEEEILSATKLIISKGKSWVNDIRKI